MAKEKITMKGVVANIIVDKNFGFIRNGKQEFFFHKSDFVGHWDDLVSDFSRYGSNRNPIEVTFEEVYSPKGLRAGNVTRKDFPNQAAV